MNVKRIAALAAGATMVASAAFAGAVSVDAGLGSFPFFLNGEPNVKVVVGARAAASDAVAAGNIAAMLGNLAYKETPVTVLGMNDLTCGAGGNATGASCTLSNKKVTLTITTPGVNPASAFSMSAYAADNLDFSVDSVRNTTSQFSSVVTHFGVNLGPKVITKELTPVLSPASGLAADGKIAYAKGSVVTKQEQRVYAYAKVEYDASAKTLQAKDAKTGYEVTFSDPIPLCLETSKPVAGCTTNYLATKNNVRITFLGQKWTIMDYAVSGGSATLAGTITQIVLGKEIAHKDIMRVNDEATTPDGYTIQLIDLSGFGYGANSLPRVSFQIKDKDGNLVKQITASEEDGANVISEANNLVVKVNQVFPGAFAKEAYADVSLYANKLDLTEGQDVSGGESHTGWKVKLTNSNVSASEGISKIQLYNDGDQIYKGTGSWVLNPGESIDLIKGMAGFKFNYLGLEDVDTDTLTFQVAKGVSLALANGSTVTGDALRIQSTKKSNAFQLFKNVDYVYVMLSGTNLGYSNGMVFFYNGSYFDFRDVSGSSPVYATGTGLQYHYSSTEMANIYVNTSWANATFGFDPASGIAQNAIIMIPEITEDANGTTAAVGNNQHWTLQYDKTLQQFVDAIGATASTKIGYNAAVPAAATTINVASQEVGYVSQRGGTFDGISSTSVSFIYPTTIRHAKFTLTAAGVSANANEADYTLSESDAALDIGSGYKVKVKEIMADASASGGSSGGDGSVDTAGLRPSVANAAVVTELGTSPMVIFDTEAGETASLVVVGGPAVNSLAQKAGVSIAAGSDPMVKVSGSKVIVAGYTAADTQTAARALVSWLSENRATVRG